jgi:hypothetical protein
MDRAVVLVPNSPHRCLTATTHACLPRAPPTPPHKHCGRPKVCRTSKHRLYEPQPLSAVVHALARGIVDSPQKFEKTAKSDSPESSDEPDTAVVSSLRVVRAAIEFWRCVAPTSHSVVAASVACWCGVARASWAMKSMQMIVVNICDMMPSRGRAGACGRNSSKKKKKKAKKQFRTRHPPGFEKLTFGVLVCNAPSLLRKRRGSKKDNLKTDGTTGSKGLGHFFLCDN